LCFYFPISITIMIPDLVFDSPTAVAARDSSRRFVRGIGEAAAATP
jgi:hypothetical protein